MTPIYGTSLEDAVSIMFDTGKSYPEVQFNEPPLYPPNPCTVSPACGHRGCWFCNVAKYGPDWWLKQREE